jgi:hypothetical protein
LVVTLLLKLVVVTLLLEAGQGVDPSPVSFVWAGEAAAAVR